MDVVETMQRLEELRSRREKLAEKESELDEQQRRMEQCLRNITEDTINEQYPTLFKCTCACIGMGGDRISLKERACGNQVCS